MQLPPELGLRLPLVGDRLLRRLVIREQARRVVLGIRTRAVRRLDHLPAPVHLRLRLRRNHRRVLGIRLRLRRALVCALNLLLRDKTRLARLVGLGGGGVRDRTRLIRARHVRLERARRIGRPPGRARARLTQVPVPHNLVQVAQLLGEILTRRF